MKYQCNHYCSACRQGVTRRLWEISSMEMQQRINKGCFVFLSFVFYYYFKTMPVVYETQYFSKLNIINLGVTPIKLHGYNWHKLFIDIFGLLVTAAFWYIHFILRFITVFTISFTHPLIQKFYSMSIKHWAIHKYDIFL